MAAGWAGQMARVVAAGWLAAVVAGCDGGAAPSTGDGGADARGDGGGPDTPALACPPLRQVEGPIQFVRPSLPGSVAMLVVSLGGPQVVGRSLYFLDGSGVFRRLLRTDDDGQTFCQLATPVPPDGFTVAAETGSIYVWTASRDGGARRLFRSENEGETWTAGSESLPGSPHILRQTGGVLLAAINLDGRDTIWESFDQGGNFRLKPLAVPAQLQSDFYWQDLRPDPADPAKLLGVIGTSAIDVPDHPHDGYYAMLLSSGDVGASWERVSLLEGLALRHIDIGDDGRLLVVSDKNEIHVREAGSSTWRRGGALLPHLGLPELWFFGQPDLIYQRSQPNLSTKTYQVARSTDLGVRWSEPFDSPYSDGFLPMRPGFLLSISASQMKFSVDDGKNFVERARLTGYDRMALTSREGRPRVHLLRSRLLVDGEGVKPWGGLPDEREIPIQLAIDDRPSGPLFAVFGTHSPGLSVETSAQRSRDDGRTWQRLELPFGELSTRRVNAVAVVSGTPPALLVGTDVGILRSEDEGETFVKASDSVVTILRAAPGLPSLVGGGPFEFVRSRDGGRSWERLSRDSPLSEIIDMVFHPTDADRVYLLEGNSAGGPGLVRRFSLASLESSFQVIANYSSTPLAGLAITTSGTLYLTGSRRGVGASLWYSRDDTVTWRDAPSETHGVGFLYVAPDPANPDGVLVTTFSGLMRVSLP
jgi:photosystem II stability/assembly factor-like uncharacterized protein